MMDDEQKLLWMFHQVYGEVTRSCYLEIQDVGEDYEDDINLSTVRVMKDGNLCWSVNKIDLVFDYLTKDL